MEDDLDQIAGGERDSVGWLTNFYFGSDEGKEGVASFLQKRKPRRLAAVVGLLEERT